MWAIQEHDQFDLKRPARLNLYPEIFSKEIILDKEKIRGEKKVEKERKFGGCKIPVTG